jgi:hypothetical protein
MHTLIEDIKEHICASAISKLSKTSSFEAEKPVIKLKGVSTNDAPHVIVVDLQSELYLF